MNKAAPGASVPREIAVGMDRTPVGHAVLSDGYWLGRVRHGGAVVWASQRFGSLHEAKQAVESRFGRITGDRGSALALGGSARSG